MTAATLDKSDSMIEATPGDYFSLLKPRVMMLVVFTAIAGMWVAPGTLDPLVACIAIACIAINAGAAGAINMWYDRDIDLLMKRTENRPIPAGKIAADDVLAFGVGLSIFSAGIMGLMTNWTAAFLLVTANAFYVFIYTVWLKRRTPQNIVIGGAAGAFPPMIGWAAVTGDVTLASVMLFMIIFLWTPPHFWALALYHKSDYSAAKIPMLPVVAGRKATTIQMLVYTIILVPVVLSPWYLGTAGMIYAGAAILLSALFVWCAVRVFIEYRKETPDHRPAKQMFGYSIIYLFALFAVLMIDRIDGLSLAAKWIS
jgi:protoheme IX farnesyltransferase